MTQTLRHIILIVALISSTTIHSMAQEIKDIFLDVPRHLLPTLSKAHREALIDLHFDARRDPNNPASTLNTLGDSAKIVTLTESFIHLSLDKGTDLQYKRLYAESGDIIIGMILTSKHSPKISVIKFYNRQWQEIPSTQILSLPTPEDFLINPQDSTLISFKNSVVERGYWDLYGTFDPERDSLTIRTSTFDSMLSRQLHENIISRLSPHGVSYTWHMGTFKKSKNNPL